MEILQMWSFIIWSLLACTEAFSMDGGIHSPNYPQAYPNNALEFWGISVPPGYGIHLYFTHLDIEPSQNCEHDFVKVLSGSRVEGQLCGQRTRHYPGSHVLMEFHILYNNLTVIFQSDFSNEGRFTGFAAYYTAVAVDCGMPHHPENGAVVYLTESEETHYQATIRYVCSEPYYTLNSNASGIYRCSANGKWVDEEEKTELPVCIPVCGVPHTPIEETGRIFGGVFAKSGNFPWHVYFYSPQGGGALISDRWIVTAAQLLDANPNPTIYAGLFLVGPSALREASPLDVDHVFIHPNWTTATEPWTNFDNDIALLRLKKPVTLGPTISPVCLPGTSSDYDPQIGTLGFVTGWGRTERQRKSMKLKAAKVPVQEMEVCRRVKPDSPADMLTYVFTDNMICAGDGRQDSCQGDSGGAYVIQDPHNETRYYVAGLVSWGPKCGTYGLYTKVANYVDWIVEIMNQYKD
ncbi:complement C1s subcomponent [Anolis sagrei]|uniref:complement C1s subcomponent n=1 Tax=Anolis sagrei TaxID=38937 RepID=UPI0035212492